MSERSSTEQGAATRARIVEAAGVLINERGVDATSLGDVRARAGVSQSQLYHHFGDRGGVIRAAIDHVASAVVSSQIEAMQAVSSWPELEAWCEFVIARIEERGGRGGCPVGTLVAAVADNDKVSRALLGRALDRWRRAIEGALHRMRANGELSAEADIERLATTLLAAFQGGVLLAKADGSSAPLRVALDGALAVLRSYDDETLR